MLLAAPTDINIHICIYVCGCAHSTAADSAGATAGADGLLGWNYYTRTILPPPVVSDVTH